MKAAEKIRRQRAGPRRPEPRGSPARPASGPEGRASTEAVAELMALLKEAPEAFLCGLYSSACGGGAAEGNPTLRLAQLEQWLGKQSPFYVRVLSQDVCRFLDEHGSEVGDEDDGDDDEAEGDEDGELSLADILDQPTEPVDVEQLGELLLAELYRVETRCRDAAEELDALNFMFDWQEPDFAVTVRVARRDNADAIDGLRELGRRLCAWLEAVCFGNSSVVALGAEGLSAVQTLAQLMPRYECFARRRLADCALRHLAESPDAAVALAAFERGRREAEASPDRPIRDRDREGWPFRQLSGKPWPAADQGAQKAVRERRRGVA